MTRTDSQIMKTLWWCYFVLVALATVSSWLSIHSVLDAVMAVFNGYALVGLWGYLRRSAIGWRKFWAAYFVLFMLSAAYSIGMVAWAAVLSHAAMLYYMLAAAILLWAPQCLALWRYAFRNTSIWQAARVTA